MSIPSTLLTVLGLLAMRRVVSPIEFVMGTLFMVVGVWCVYLAGMEYDYQMEKRRYRNKR